MSTETKEHLSALMDGEIERDAARFVLRAVETDRTLAADWSRFHLVRDCLQRRDVLVADAGFAAAVMARIDIETAPAQAGSSRWVRYLSGGAVAAAVAVVALMASSPMQPPAQVGTVASSVGTAPPVRTSTFNDSSLGPRIPLAQPASATVGGETLFAPGYDLRSQPSNGWRPAAESGFNARTPQAPYVLLIVPMKPMVQPEPNAQPRLQ
ncbi:MAG TPA: sigma-E factor negative regulatory protein [Tahibacter sp.]|uniref:sigma-E factor negative regulatory protein n=1 Tax=Tahibacter sp. TaxID=2056211 RepID=UPI002C0E949F|nr:sigma-E factor negative regulatory protein [Tahibacter sp.]HSX61436.1 sigma-E factor negative regulatory protein [Tahibacter sp.]